MEKAIAVIKSFTQYEPNIAIYATEVERGAITNTKIPRITTEDRISKYALNDRMFWLGGPVEPTFDTHCQSLGTVLIQYSTPINFLTSLPKDYLHFFNNQPGFRMVYCVTQQNKDDVEGFISAVRAKKLTIPILLWITGEDQSLINDGIWGRHTRIWCTSRAQVLQEYSKTQVGLLWAPDMRFGTLGFPSWKGSITIQDLTARNFVIREKKPPLAFATASIGDTVYTTKPIKEFNPRWTSLDFVVKCSYNSTLVILLHDKENKKSAAEGRVEIKMADLLSGVSSVGVSYLVKTFPVKRIWSKNPSKTKSSKSALQASPFLGTVTLTAIFSHDVPPMKSCVPGFEKDLSHVDLFYKNPQQFGVEFPTSNNLLPNICGDDKEKIALCLEHAADTRTIVHRKVLPLIREYLALKKEQGTKAEKEVYRGMTVESFTTRLFLKRPLTFYQGSDDTLLRDGNTHRDWTKVGSDAEGNIKLRDYMSYDELLISALFGIASPTLFINNGDRKNCGRVAFDVSTYEREGVFVGLVGTRFERMTKMESIHMLVNQKESVPEKGYGKDGERVTVQSQNLQIWAKFYQQGNLKEGDYYFPSWQECVEEYEASQDAEVLSEAGQLRWKNIKYLKVKEDLFLNIEVYKMRLRLVIEAFLTAADTYAKNANKTAFCHAIGLGLGSWGLKPFLAEQAEIIMLCYYELLSEKSFPAISDLAFAWFPETILEFCGKKNGEVLVTPKNKVTIRIGNRNPSDPVRDSKKLLVAQYAWDSNAFPGNEYWLGARHLTMSGDPAAACSSTIVQLQNPMINPSFLVKSPILAGDLSDAQPAQGSVQKEKSSESLRTSPEERERKERGNEGWHHLPFQPPREGRSRAPSLLNDDDCGQSHQEVQEMLERQLPLLQEQEEAVQYSSPSSSSSEPVTGNNTPARESPSVSNTDSEVQESAGEAVEEGEKEEEEEETSESSATKDGTASVWEDEAGSEQEETNQEPETYPDNAENGEEYFPNPEDEYDTSALMAPIPPLEPEFQHLQQQHQQLHQLQQQLAMLQQQRIQHQQAQQRTRAATLVGMQTPPQGPRRVASMVMGPGGAPVGPGGVPLGLGGMPGGMPGGPPKGMPMGGQRGGRGGPFNTNVPGNRNSAGVPRTPSNGVLGQGPGMGQRGGGGGRGGPARGGPPVSPGGPGGGPEGYGFPGYPPFGYYPPAGGFGPGGEGARGGPGMGVPPPFAPWGYPGPMGPGAFPPGWGGRGGPGPANPQAASREGEPGFGAGAYPGVGGYPPYPPGWYGQVGPYGFPAGFEGYPGYENHGEGATEETGTGEAQQEDNAYPGYGYGAGYGYPNPMAPGFGFGAPGYGYGYPGGYESGYEAQEGEHNQEGTDETQEQPKGEEVPHQTENTQQVTQATPTTATPTTSTPTTSTPTSSTPALSPSTPGRGGNLPRPKVTALPKIQHRVSQVQLNQSQ
eukprot:TRINITY_DN321_c0_g1_i2.p1 TRINITY_DN321_c0_g1~~TRINITY_DN321_c0_g1_i2.p1  ORF type:complete len:1568 (-),score=371.64 TRINITY_DN321_c0_g1_i2:268-4602(-)